MRRGLVVALWSVGSLGLLLGCSGRPTQGDGGDPVGSTSEAPTVPPDSPTVPPDTTTTTFGTSGTGGGPIDSSDDGVSDGNLFCNVGDEHHWYCQPDSGSVSFVCDLFAQDCARGDKCLPWANDGGSVWNGTRCSPVAPRADAPGESCTVEGAAVSGIDSCELGAMCWNVDPATNIGECVPFCEGDEATPVCADGTRCKLTNNGAVNLCLPPCNPLASECDAGQVCVPDRHGEWSCVPGISEPFAAAEPCDYGNVCDGGSVCIDPIAFDACAGSMGCCASICDLALGDCADPATTCVPWYEPGVEPPGLEGLGVCTVIAKAPNDGWLLGGDYWLTADLG
ncbi:MAG: hypothetical protein AAF799_02400 [Myxococcota bacterium]